MGTTPTPAPGPAAEEAHISTVGRLTGALFSPKATFADIARKPGWIVPVIIGCILSIITTPIIGKRVGWRDVVEKQIASSKRAQERIDSLGAKQKEQAIQRQVAFSPYVGYVIFPLGMFLVALALAGILLGAFNGLAGAELDFKTSLGIVTHSYMPAVIAQLLSIMVLYLKSPDLIDVQNIVASNIGAFLSDDAPKWLTALLTSFDLFSFWTIFLLGLGFSVARPKKISMGRALGTVMAVWALYVILKVGATAIFS
jgi:hypothetical protein